MKVTLNKIMFVIILTMLATNIHLYKSRNNALLESGRVSEQLVEANRTIDDVIARNASNMNQLRVLNERNSQLLLSLEQLQTRQDMVNNDSDTKVIEVIRYAESNKESVVNSSLPDNVIGHLRKPTGM